MSKTLHISLMMFALTLCQQASAIAKYRGSALQTLQYENTPKDGEISFAYKKFNRSDCKKHLGRRRILSKGYQPIQIQITNKTQHSLSLNPNSFDCTCLPYLDVAEDVGFNTTKRIVMWGLGSLFLWPLVIPLAIEAIEAPKANDKLVDDYCQKTLSHEIIQPYTTLNKLIFVEKDTLYRPITATVVDNVTKQRINFTIQ